MKSRVSVPVIAALALLAVVSLAQLWAQLADRDVVADATQALLMPLLGLTLLLAVWPDGLDAPLVVLTLVALFFSWLGDTAPRFLQGDAAFLVMVGFFLLAQIAYVRAFAPYVDASVLRARRAGLVPYVLAVVVLVLLCASGAGWMLLPVLIYGVVLGAMAVLATGVNPLVCAGGATFLVSDGLIAINAFADDVDLWQPDFWVMLTYIAAQLLIVGGVLRETRDLDLFATGT